jgi:hypothetical protein
LKSLQTVWKKRIIRYLYWSGLRTNADGRKGVRALRGREEDEREKRRNGEWETIRPGEVFLGNQQSSWTVIPGYVWSVCKSANRAPSFRDPGARVAKCADDHRHVKSREPGAKESCPLNKCR